MLAWIFLTAASVAGLSAQSSVGEGEGSMTCMGGFKLFGSSCYAYIDHSQTWSDAQSTCKALGAFLVEIESAAENNFIQALAQDNDHHTIWLGADDIVSEGTWYWATSEAEVSNYDDWAPGQPDSDSTGDENCMEMNVDRFSSHWNDDECHHKQRFVCEKYAQSAIIG